MEDTNYIIAYQNEWKFLKKKNPLEVSKVRGTDWNADNEIMTITFLNEDYLLFWREEKILNKENGTWPLVEVSIMILNYLRHSNVMVTRGLGFVSLKEMPGGGSLFYPAFYKNSILSLCHTFGNDIQAFKESGKALGGMPTKGGDAGMLFRILPLIDLKVIVWAGDDELPPSANILFDHSAKEVMHIESAIGLGMHLSKELTKIKKEEKDDQLETRPIFF